MDSREKKRRTRIEALDTAARAANEASTGLDETARSHRSQRAQIVEGSRAIATERLGTERLGTREIFLHALEIVEQEPDNRSFE